MARTLHWDPSTLVIPLGDGLYRLFQALARRNLVATAPLLSLTDAAVGGMAEDALQRRWAALPEQPALADATAFTLWDNAYRNADFFDRGVGRAALQALPFDDLVELLLELGILSETWPPDTGYRKRSFADRFRGSFYEQVGTESLLERCPPAQWWTRQKFAADGSLRDTPYKFIEEHFLDGYFARTLPGKRVLEIGSGTGYFTARMAAHAKSADGLDYNADYVAEARGRWGTGAGGNLAFHTGDLLALDPAGPPLNGRRFDVLAMIDFFLFFFDDKYQGALHGARVEVMARLRSLLEPGGWLFVVDPHPLWLTPWLGLEDRPFGLLTEYRHKRLKVAPTVEEATGLLFDAGWRIRRILEPGIDPAYAKADPAAYNFMADVPQWWCIEAEPA